MPDPVRRQPANEHTPILTKMSDMAYERPQQRSANTGPDCPVSDELKDELSLDHILETFETAWNSEQEVDLRTFLPPQGHPEYREILHELLCVDLERSHKAGRTLSAGDYRDRYSDLVDQAAVERLAFEEYRLRSRSEPAVSPAQFARRYGVRTEHWPQTSTKLDGADAVAQSAMADGVAEEMQRIVGVAQELPKVGEQFLNFEILEQLGECRFGSVYLATQSNLANRPVVIKVTTNLWSESDRLARLQHTNIVPIYSVHQHNGLQAVCMPYLGRRTLLSLLKELKEKRNLPGKGLNALLAPRDDVSLTESAGPSRQLTYLRQLSFEHFCTWMIANIAAGLSHAHDRGILHRDLKPANILLADDVQPLILDFNLSEDAVAGGRASLLIGGTLPYMAPEHLRAVVADGEVDQRSDVYALGVMFFQLLTGHLPFPVQDGSIIGNLSFVMNDRRASIPSVRSFDASLSSDVDSMVRRCLAPLPGDRYQAAHELQEDLDRHLRHLPLRHAQTCSRTERARKWARRHPRASSGVAIGALAAVVVATALGGLFLRGRQLETLEAERALTEFGRLNSIAVASLNPVVNDRTLIEEGVQAAASALALFAADDPDWRSYPPFTRLSNESQSLVSDAVGNIQFLVGDSQAEHVVAARAAGPRPLERSHEGSLANAIRCLRAGQYADARELLMARDRDSPPEFLTLFLLGNSHFALHELSQADSCFTAAATLMPSFHAPLFHRGVTRMKLQRWDEAEEDFSDVVQLCPTHTAALINRALARIELREHASGLDDLSRAIELGRDESLVYLLRAQAFTALGRSDEAAHDREKGIGMAPTSVEGWIQRALARRKVDPEGALADLKAAQAMNPQSRKALQNEAAILSMRNRDEDAVDVLTKLIELSPTNATNVLGRGLLRARLGDRDGALADAERARRHVISATHQFQLARLFAQTSRFADTDQERAVGHLRRALKLRPGLVAVALADHDLRPITDRRDVQVSLAAAKQLASP